MLGQAVAIGLAGGMALPALGVAGVVFAQDFAKEAEVAPWQPSFKVSGMSVGSATYYSIGMKAEISVADDGGGRKVLQAQVEPSAFADFWTAFAPVDLAVGDKITASLVLKYKDATPDLRLGFYRLQAPEKGPGADDQGLWLYVHNGSGAGNLVNQIAKTALYAGFLSSGKGAEDVMSGKLPASPFGTDSSTITLSITRKPDASGQPVFDVEYAVDGATGSYETPASAFTTAFNVFAFQAAAGCTLQVESLRIERSPGGS